MKKTLSLLLAMVVMLCSVTAFAESGITLMLNGIKLDTEVPPVVVNGRTLVPARVIFEAFGLPVQWNEKFQMVYVKTDNTSIYFEVGAMSMMVNDAIIKLDVAPIIYEGRTLVPARALCEQALGCKVDWDEASKTVSIKTKNYIEPPVYTPVIDQNPVFIENKADIPGELINLINNARTENGLGVVEYDSSLNALALAHSTDMAVNDYFDHVTSDGQTLNDRLENAGISYVVACENLGSGFVGAEEVFKAWMNSDGHKKNLLNENVKSIGLGRYEGGSNGIYWTLVLVG